MSQWTSRQSGYRRGTDAVKYGKGGAVTPVPAIPVTPKGGKMPTLTAKGPVETKK